MIVKKKLLWDIKAPFKKFPLSDVTIIVSPFPAAALWMGKTSLPKSNFKAIGHV